MSSYFAAPVWQRTVGSTATKCKGGGCDSGSEDKDKDDGW